MAAIKREPRSEKNLDGYGAPPIPWSKVRERFDQGFTQGPEEGGPNRHTCWLATVGVDGRPHVMPIGLLWIDGLLYFNAGATTRKAQNLAQDARCSIAVAAHDFDLVVEGMGRRVTEPGIVSRVAEAFRAQGWPATASTDGITLTADYSAPSAGPPPWNVYEITPETVFALGASEPFGAERWQF